MTVVTTISPISEPLTKVSRYSEGTAVTMVRGTPASERHIQLLQERDQVEWIPANGVWDRTLVAFEFTDNDDAPCACFWELDLDDYDPYCDPMYEAPVGSWYIVDM